MLSCILFFTLSQAQEQNSLLWKIQSKNSNKVSYIFGTMHTQDKRVFDLDSAIVPLILSSSLFVPEADMSSFKEGNLKKLFLPAGKTLRDIFTKEQYDFIAREFENRSPKPFEELDRLQPFALFMFVEEPSHYALPLTLDDYLLTVARKAGIPIHSLESLDEQISFLSEAQRPEYVYNYFKNIEKYKLLQSELRQAYIDVDYEKLLKIVYDRSMAGYDMDILVDKRNRKMISRIDSIAQRQTAFFAIGAAHLFGEGGIVSGLSKMGYFVTPVRNKKQILQTIRFHVNWLEHVSFDGNFAVKFPEAPKVQRQKNENLFTSDFVDGNVLSMTFVVNEKVSSSFSAIKNKTAAKMFLDGVKSSFSTDLGFRVLSSRSFDFNGNHALETVFDCNNGVNLMHVRFLLVRDRVYVLSVMVKHNTEDLISIQEFMNSFRVLK